MLDEVGRVGEKVSARAFHGNISTFINHSKIDLFKLREDAFRIFHIE